MAAAVLGALALVSGCRQIAGYGPAPGPDGAVDDGAVSDGAADGPPSTRAKVTRLLGLDPYKGALKVAGVGRDSSGHTYVAGTLHGSVIFKTGTSEYSPQHGPEGSDRLFVARFDANGTLSDPADTWALVLGDQLTSLTVSAAAVAPDGRMVVVGSFKGSLVLPGVQPMPFGTAREAGFVALFDERGVAQWGKLIATDDATGHFSRVHAVAFDAAEKRIAVVGEYAGGLPLDGATTIASVTNSVGQPSVDGFVIVFDDKGQHQWGARFGGQDEDRALAVALHKERVAIGGLLTNALGRTLRSTAGASAPQLINDSHGGGDALLAVFEAKGTLLRHLVYGGSPGPDRIEALAYDDNKRLYVAGTYAAAMSAPMLTNTGGAGDIFVLAIDDATQLVWYAGLGGKGDDSVTGLVVDAAGAELILAGNAKPYFYRQHSTGAVPPLIKHGPLSAQGDGDGFIARFKGGSGAMVDTPSLLGGSGDDRLTAMALQNKMLTLAGSHFSGQPTIFGPTRGGGLDAAFLTAVDVSNWQRHWLTSTHGTRTTAIARAVIASNGDVIAIGRYTGAIVGSGTCSLAPSEGADVFLVRFDVQGECRWLQRIHSGGADTPKDLALAGDTLYALVDHSGTLQAGTLTSAPANHPDFAVVSLDVKDPDVATVTGIWSSASSGEQSGARLAISDTELIIAGTYRSAFGSLPPTTGKAGFILTTFLTELKPIIRTSLPPPVDRWSALEISALATRDGRVFVGGQVNTPIKAEVDPQEAFVAEIDLAKPALLWQRWIKGTETQTLRDMASTTNGELVILATGSGQTTVLHDNFTLDSRGATDCYVARFATRTGDQALDPPLWAFALGGKGDDDCTQLAIDGEGNALVAATLGAGGHYQKRILASESETNRGVLVAIRPHSPPAWHLPFGTSTFPMLHGVAAAANGKRVAVFGEFNVELNLDGQRIETGPNVPARFLGLVELP